MKEVPCPKWGERPDDGSEESKQLGCNDCEVVLGCSILALRQMACVAKKTVEIVS